jgi:lysozyme family protein
VHWDNQVRLEFGEGVNTKTNMVPMPKLSGLTYQTFKDLQRQINRLLTKVPGGGRVAEDGILGTQTLAALKSIEKSRGRIWGVDASDTFRMAKYAATIATTLKDDANSLAISPSANMGRTTTTTSQNEKTKGKTPSGDSTWIYLLLAGGVAWYAAQKKGKKKK